MPSQAFNDHFERNFRPVHSERAEHRRAKWQADAEARELLEALRDPNSEGPRF